MMISAKTGVYAVIGDPVAHSMSPMIHNAWIAEAKLDAVYVALRVAGGQTGGQAGGQTGGQAGGQTGGEASRDIAALARAGLSGLNVTLPHKTAALAAASETDEASAAIGAANTLAPDGAGGWRAFNTDVAGFEAALKSATGGVAPKKVVLIGAGGAARAALYALGRSGAAVTIVNRTRETAEAAASRLSPQAAIVGLDRLGEAAEGADVIVNSASLGHAKDGRPGERLPGLPAGQGRPFLDLSYGKAAGPILADASAAGWTPHDGLTMLAVQAAEAFRIWFGISPDTTAALTRCRTAMMSAS